MIFTQANFEIRCEWGLQGVTQLAPISDVVIIVDLFSFTTCVEIATQQGAHIYPYRGDDAAAFAQAVGAAVAVKWGDAGYSLSPHSLLRLPAGLRLVLPSPNGSTLSMSTGQTPTLAGCLRNFGAVAAAATTYGRRISVVPAGERWREDGSLRPAYEDWLGAGAIISHLAGQLSPEARAARAAFLDAQGELEQLLTACGSAQEHVMRGLAENVALVGALNVSDCVPLLVDGVYQQVQH
ncbi:MAG: 2-phosphosulfolactate phosphatase [Caldilineaceae bacterium]